MATLLSLQTCSCAVRPRAWAAAATPRPSAAPATMPASSASPELRALVFRVAKSMCLRPRVFWPLRDVR
eukprot:15459128-Alexandrium_andersonii.AAC.1